MDGIKSLIDQVSGVRVFFDPGCCSCSGVQECVLPTLVIRMA